MGKLDALWAYQKTDMEVSRFENEMRRDPTRNKLLRLRNFVVEQQNILQSLEEGAVKAQKRVADMEDVYKQNEQAVAEGGKRLDEGAFTTLEEVQAALRDAQRLLENLKGSERELKGIVSEAEAMEDKLRDIRSKVAQARTQYNTLKEGYDKTFAEQSVKLGELKGLREEAGRGIDPALIKRYEGIKKQHTQPVPQPVAKLLGDQCGGCNMSLPAVVLKRVRDDSNVVECENCGRILYLGE